MSQVKKTSRNQSNDDPQYIQYEINDENRDDIREYYVDDLIQYDPVDNERGHARSSNDDLRSHENVASGSNDRVGIDRPAGGPNVDEYYGDEIQYDPVDNERGYAHSSDDDLSYENLASGFNDQIGIDSPADGPNAYEYYGDEIQYDPVDNERGYAHSSDDDLRSHENVAIGSNDRVGIDRPADGPNVDETHVDIADLLNDAISDDNILNYLSDDLIDLVYKNEKEISGHRILNIGFLFEQIKELNQHSDTDSCGFHDMVVTNEIKRGLNSTFEFKCNVCGKFKKIVCCPENEHSLGVNAAAVLGISSVGLGFYHLQEFFSLLNVPCMSYAIYSKISKSQQADWWSLAKKMAFEALMEEVELAIQNNEVDEFGNALIAVICDGSWGKRSYGKGFSSLSGCAVMMGLRTKKVIYFDVRNKYCHICEIARSKNTPVKNHECNCNYSGASSAMETHIIVEGFKESKLHGVRYHKFIADGDSSTYKAIRDLRIYENQLVEKYECVNHLYRNFRSRFGNLSSIAKFSIDGRKLITSKKCEEICKGVQMATKHWRESNISLLDKISNLEKDILNAPSHYFGVHTICSDYFCKKATDPGAIDTLNFLKQDGLFYEILNQCQTYFANNAKSLLQGYTANAAEGFNGIIAKYLGGKRINYSLAGSYSARVATAVVQYNSNGRAGSAYHKFKFGDLFDSSNIEKLETTRKRKCEVNAIRREGKPKIRRFEADKTRNFYGQSCAKPDMEPDAFECAKERFFAQLQHNQSNRQAIERSTIGQKHNPKWFQIRQNLIPSTFFARILNSKGPESYKKIVEEILYDRTEFGNSAEVRHEQNAITVFASLNEEVTLEQCGMAW